MRVMTLCVHTAIERGAVQSDFDKRKIKIAVDPAAIDEGGGRTKTIVYRETLDTKGL